MNSLKDNPELQRLKRILDNRSKGIYLSEPAFFELPSEEEMKEFSKSIRGETVIVISTDKGFNDYGKCVMGEVNTKCEAIERIDRCK